MFSTAESPREKGVFEDLKVWKYKLGSQMDVSKDKGTLKSSSLIGFSFINHSFWGTPILGNPQIELTNPFQFGGNNWQLKHPPHTFPPGPTKAPPLCLSASAIHHCSPATV